jgi:hypothetical protein
MANVRLSLVSTFKHPSRQQYTGFSMFKRIFSRENLFAILLCLVLIAIVIASADQAPQWIYQGF